jgi:IclR family transcriptional regulator, acetate operon repressor
VKLEQERRLVGAERVLAVLVELGSHPLGIGLDSLSQLMGAPKPSVHRALATLRRQGLAAQDDHGSYLLGDEFLKIAFANHEARPAHLRVQPILRRLLEEFGETVHYTELDGRAVVYRSKVDPVLGAMKLSSVVGGRNPAHATGAGKVLLAYELLDLEAVRTWIGGIPLAAPTRKTITEPQELHEELERIRVQGFAVDDQENEPGINCIAVPVFYSSPTQPTGAISLSALAHRTPLQQLIDKVDIIRAAVTDQHWADEGGNRQRFNPLPDPASSSTH